MKKIFLVLIVLVVISFVPIFKGSSVYTGANPAGYNGPFVTKTNFWEYLKIKNDKNSYQNQDSIQNNIKLSLPTREEVISKNGFTVSSPRWGGGLIDEHADMHLEGFFSAPWGQKIEKALIMLEDQSSVYDSLVISPVSECPNCSPLAVEICTNNKNDNKSSIIGLYETKGHDPIKAWTVDPKTLKFVEYTNVEDLKCNLPEF